MVYGNNNKRQQIHPDRPIQASSPTQFVVTLPLVWGLFLLLFLGVSGLSRFICPAAWHSCQCWQPAERRTRRRGYAGSTSSRRSLGFYAPFFPRRVLAAERLGSTRLGSVHRLGSAGPATALNLKCCMQMRLGDHLHECHRQMTALVCPHVLSA